MISFRSVRKCGAGIGHPRADISLNVRMGAKVKRCFALIFFLLVSAAGEKTVNCAETVPVQAAKAGAGTKEAATCGQAAEKHLPKEEPFTPWLLDPSVFAQDQGDRTEKRLVPEKEVKTIKLANLVPPIRFRTGESDIPDEYLALLRGVLEKMKGRDNVRLHFVGHADPQNLSESLKAKYGDNTGLSRERAGTTAEYCQRALGLPVPGDLPVRLGDGDEIADAGQVHEPRPVHAPRVAQDGDGGTTSPHERPRLVPTYGFASINALRGCSEHLVVSGVDTPGNDVIQRVYPSVPTFENNLLNGGYSGCTSVGTGALPAVTNGAIPSRSWRELLFRRRKLRRRRRTGNRQRHDDLSGLRRQLQSVSADLVVAVSPGQLESLTAPGRQTNSWS